MEFNEYQIQTSDTAIYPMDLAHSYLALGLAGEAGEVANKVKKSLRDNHGFINTGMAYDIQNELGDCLWYIAQLCETLGLTLDQTAVKNLEKLQSRKQRGTLGGSGDDR
jgi:NTP pyrophosphatase (non-canonical NTP hydrolase)